MIPEIHIYFVILIPFLLTMVMMPVGVKLLNYLDILDHPDFRKQHARPTPGTGGIIFFIPLLISVIIFMDFSTELVTYGAGVTFLVMVGLADDIRTLSPYNKLFAQALAALLFVSITRQYLQIPFLSNHPAVSAILTIIYIVAVTNSVNLIDGLDGLAAGLGIIGIGVLSFFLQGTEFFILILIIAGVIFGFLRANTFPAMIFMGDSGSYFIGYSYAIISIVAIREASIPFWVPILILGVPIIDMTVVFFQRLLHHKNVFVADRSHIHFRIMDLGISHKNTVFLLYSIQSIAALLTYGYLSSFSSRLVAALALLIIFTVQHIFLILRLDLGHQKPLKIPFYTVVFEKFPFLKKAYIYFFLSLLFAISINQIYESPVVGHRGIVMVFVALVTAYLFILDKNAGRTANVSIGMILLAGLNIIISQMGSMPIELKFPEIYLWLLLVLGVLFSAPGMFKQHNIFDSPTEFLLIIILLFSTLHHSDKVLSVTGYLLILLFVVYKILLQSEVVRRYNLIYVINILTATAIIIKSL